MENILDTPPSEDNAGEICFGECKDKVEKLKKDFLILKKKIFCSQDLIKKYNNKVKENEQMSTNIQTLQASLKLTEKKLNKRNIAVQSNAVRLRLENEKLRKASEDVAKLKEEYEIKIASDKQYIQQLVCKLKELEDQNLDKLMKIELEKSGLQGKVKELEREIRNLQKNREKTGSVSPTKPNEPKKRGRKPLNNQKTVGLPVLENDLNCIDIEENDPKPELISESDNTRLQEECQNTSSANIEVQKLSDSPEIVLENEFKINLSSLEDKLSEKPICIDKNIMTDEYYDLKDNPYPLFCHKCRTLLKSKPVDEILNGMQMKPLITEFSRSPVHERNETSPDVHSNMSIIVENLEKKIKKLEKRISKIKQTQNSYQNVPHCNHSHVQNWCRDNSMNDSFSLMNMMTTLINTMHSNKKKKKNRTKRLQRCKKKIHRKKNNCIDNWDVEPCNLDNAENTDDDSELLHTPIYTPLINHTKNNRSFSYSTSKNCIENSEEINNRQTKHHNNTEIEKAKKISKKSKKKRTNDNDQIEDEKINNDFSEYQKQSNNHTENQYDDNNIINYNKESSNKITNIEKNVDVHHEEKNVNYDINTRFNELYSSNVTSIELISPSSLNTGAVQKRKKGKTNTNTVSIKSSLLTRLRQLRNKSTKLPAKIFRNETLDNVERTEELNDTPIKKRRIAHVPKQDCFDDPTNNSVKTIHEEQLILNRLRVTRSMAKSSLSPNTSLEKKSLNSLRAEENSIINNTTNLTDDNSSFQQEHQKDSESSFDKNQIDSNSTLDISEKTHSNGQERQDSDKTQGLNNNCENKILSISYELDNNKEEKSLETPSKVNKIDMKESEMFIDLEKLIENETNEGIHLENNPELSDELFVSSDSKVEKFALLEQEEPLTSSEPEIKESPASLESKQRKSPSSSEPEIKELSASSESKQRKSLSSSEPEIKELSASSESNKKKSLSSQPEIEESPALSESRLEESLVSLESEIEETSLSLSSKLEKTLASPNSKLKESSVSLGSKSKELPMPGESPVSLDPKLTTSSTSNNPVTSDKLSKTSVSTSEFYKDCVINLRNRTVAISPLKTINDSNNKLFGQNNCSLLDQYILQVKPKSTKKWSQFHHEAAMKLAKGAEEYVKMELKNLLDAEAWTSLENEQIVNNLKTINNRSIVKSVVEFLIELSDLQESLDRTFTPPAPMMTKSQQKIVALLKKLDGLKNIIIDVLNSIEYAIFHMNSDITYEAAEELARIFTVLAKIKKDRERVRIMCCDALYCLQKKGMFILSAVITSWPEVLPSHQEDRFQYLPACIAYAVKTFKNTQNEFSTKITQLNKLIRNMYKYPDELLTSKSFVEKLLTDLMTPDHDRSVYTAIILLSKKEGSEWTYKNIINGGLLGMIVENKSSNVREALKLLGYLMKSFPIVDESGYVKKITDQLCAILDSGAIPIDIQEGVVFALLSLSRHNFNQVAESISMWQPPQNLSSELEEQLNIFFELRNLNFWKQFKKKKKM